ncbi:MAG TPA: type I-B CRISPR-associated endonuclease Cas1b [Bacteroidales bacterium]|nr:type I-B CRISPR-associated endonuclease Cas1b [Bacteroidales bacterium]
MKKTYYLFNPGKLSRKDNTLKFVPHDKDGKELSPKYLPVEQVGQMFVFGNLEASSSLYNFLGQNEIAVHFFDYYENYTGSFLSRDYLLAGKMIIEQVKHYNKLKLRMAIAKEIIQGAAYNMLKNLAYYNSRGKDLKSQIERIKLLKSNINNTQKIDELMGIEGNIRNCYYEGIDIIINSFEMGTRSTRPPQNEVNALISFGNMIIYSQVLRSIHQTQLNPTISYLHQPGERRYSLSLDIAEIFKPIIVDRVIFKVLNKRILSEKDFDKSLNRVLLNNAGKKKFLESFDNRMLETIKHRTLNRHVSYKHLIKLECYKLKKHLLNIEEYKSFKMYW